MTLIIPLPKGSEASAARYIIDEIFGPNSSPYECEQYPELEEDIKEMGLGKAVVLWLELEETFWEREDFTDAQINKFMTPIRERARAAKLIT